MWLTGGWGIDALLGEQTRPHKDLDLIMLLDDAGRMREILSGDGYDLVWLWEENLWTVDAQGIETPTAFILQDAHERQLDIHTMRLDEDGNGIPAWQEEGLVFSAQGLAGEGTIAGVAVRCLSPEMQVVCHTGYVLPDYQARDLRLLRNRFGGLP